MYGQHPNRGCGGGYSVVARCFGEDVLRPILTAEKLSIAGWDTALSHSPVIPPPGATCRPGRRIVAGLVRAATVAEIRQAPPAVQAVGSWRACRGHQLMAELRKAFCRLVGLSCADAVRAPADTEDAPVGRSAAAEYMVAGAVRTPADG